MSIFAAVTNWFRMVLKGKDQAVSLPEPERKVQPVLVSIEGESVKRYINEIILHCSATPASRDIGAKEIRDWHVKGNGWQDIGYHFVIRRSGDIESGRPMDQAGAHCIGHNATSVGICLVGGVKEDGKTPEDNFTDAQFDMLAELIRALRVIRPKTKIYGHNEFANKACPVFDVDEFLESYGISREGAK